MGRPQSLKEKNNVECIACGSILTRCRGGGRSDYGDYRLRRRVCDDCGQLFVTAEIPLLYEDGTPVALSALDSDYRNMQRRVRHAQVPYFGTAMGRKPIVKSASLQVITRIGQPVRASGPGPFEVSMPKEGEATKRPYVACPRGHDISVMGRGQNHRCKECNRLDKRVQYATQGEERIA